MCLSVIYPLNTKSDQNIHQDASNCTFFQLFSRRVACPMCAADIIISIKKELFFHSKCNQNIHYKRINYDMFSKKNSGSHN